MKAIVQNMKTGKLGVEEVPAPLLKDRGILVRVRRSLVSLGTERAVISLANKGMLGKARERPDLLRKVLEKARQEGYWSTFQVVMNLIESPVPLGYSCAGDVIEVGAESREFRVGDRVACAGLGFANHAEIDYVPRNLAAKIPGDLSYERASFVTMGAIAMHGVRLSRVALGETVVVVGLGLVGQIVAQLLRCAGASVIATDLDPFKRELAVRLGAQEVVAAGDALSRTVAARTRGHGADAVLLCAATKSDEPIRQAAELSRLKGRVVVVGDVGMSLERRPFFEKEVELVVSRSYGPGRYDPEYEVRGGDYPLPYVRWTERRNMEAFLGLLERGEIVVDPLVTHRVAIESAESAYGLLTGERNEPAVAIVIGYEDEAPRASRVELRRASAVPRDAIRVGVIGAGQFARGVLLPAFAGSTGVELAAFCTSSGLTSKAVAERYGARYCTSDPMEIVADAGVDAVVVATRHDRHAALAAAALRAGKAVFVEKPLALTRESLDDLREAASQHAGAPPLMVGFNRRFAPLAARAKSLFEPRVGPLSLLLRVNAGTLPPDSWVRDPVEGGGRILGEVCHFVDLACFLTGARPRRVYAETPSADRETVIVTLRLSDDSVAVIHYTADGDSSVPKEYVEVSGAQRMAILDNYRRLSLHREGGRRRVRSLNQNKGHREEVAAFVEAVRSGGPMPIDWTTLVAVTEATFAIHESLDSASPVECGATDPRSSL